MSNFKCNKEYEHTHGSLWVNVTDKFLLYKFAKDSAAKVYKHNEYERCLNDLRGYLNEYTINKVKDFILTNYDHKGIYYVKEKPGDQMSLF